MRRTDNPYFLLVVMFPMCFYCQVLEINKQTFTRFSTARKQLHFNHVVSERTKGGINLNIEREKHKLDQIYARNITTTLDKRIAFSK